MIRCSTCVLDIRTIGMKPELMDRLRRFLEKHPGMRGRAASLEEIAKAEDELAVKMADDYKEFIREFGGAWAGIDIHAFSNGSSRETVVDLTRRSRSLFDK